METTGYIENRVADGSISAEDAEILKQYLNESIANLGWDKTTVTSNSSYAVRVLKELPIKNWNLENVQKTVVAFRNLPKANTSRKCIRTLKEFGRWLIGNGTVSTISIDKLNSIKIPAADRMTHTAGDMLLDDEIEKLIKATRSSRDRAIISVLAESAVRPVELRLLKWGDVMFDDKGCVINTNEKTGNPRHIRIIRSASHLIAWKNDYPGIPSKTSPVFLTMKSKPYQAFGDNGFRKIIKKAVNDSGIKNKRIYGYLFRHSRITSMVSNPMIPETVIKKMAWGNTNSNMLATYAHLSDDQSDDILLAAEGRIEKKPIKQVAVYVACPRCGADQPSGLSFCGICGSVLDAEKYQHELSENADLKKRIDDLEILIHVMQKNMNPSIKKINMLDENGQVTETITTE